MLTTRTRRNVCVLFTLIIVGVAIAQAQNINGQKQLRKLRPKLRPRSIETNGNCQGTEGSAFENLRGKCMFHYECVRRDGRSIGSCFNNHLVGSCCVYDNKNNHIQSKHVILSNADNAEGNNYQPNLYKTFGTVMDNTDSTSGSNSDMPAASQTYYYYPSPSASPIVTSGSSYYYPSSSYYETVAVPTVQNISLTVPSSLWDSWNNAQTTRSSVRPPMMLTRTTDSISYPSHNSISSLNSIQSQWPTDYHTGSSQYGQLPSDSTEYDDDSHLLGVVISSNNRQSTTRRPDYSYPSELDPVSYPYSSPDTYPMTASSDSHYQLTSSTSNQNPLVSNPVIEDVNSNHFPVYPPFTSYPNKPTPSKKPTVITTEEATSDTISTTNKTKKRKKPTSTTTNKPNRWNVAPSTVASTQSTSSSNSRRTCGVRPLRPTGRVVGGRNAQFGEWPWQVLIKESSWLGFFMKAKCGGVLIDYKWVLTAAHCQPGIMGSLIVKLGQHEQDGTAQQLRPVIKTVKRMIVHRDYNPETFDNDIALLELDVPFKMEPHIVPICLPYTDENYIGTYAHVAGFGKLSYGGIIPNIMQTVKLPIIDNQNCQKMFADAGHYKYIRDHFLCAGYLQGGKDTCEGDSGGPLMVQKNGIWTLIGTVSHGIKCAEPNMPGVYMKTYSYLNWIYGIIGRK